MIIRHPEDHKISLTNNGDLSVVFIGCGSAFATRNYQNNLLIIKGEDHVQIDCGTRCATALREIGLSVTMIKNYHITHSHADHVGGLEEVGLIGRYISPNKPNVYITKEYQDMLWNDSLKGGSAYSEKNGGKFLSFEDFYNPVRPKKIEGYPRDTYEFNVGSINIKMMRTTHIPSDSESWMDSVWSNGIIIDDRVLFTGDTKFDENLILNYDRLFDFETIFHDVQFFRGGVHAFLDDLATLPNLIKSKTYLMHYNDNWEQYTEKIKAMGFVDYVIPHVYYDFKNASD